MRCFGCFRNPAVLFLATLLVTSCANLPSIEAPHLSVIAVEIEQANLLEQKYWIKVRVQNPNDYDLAVTGMKFELDLNEQAFLRGVSDQGFVVPRYGQAVTEVGGLSTIFSFVRQIQALQDGEIRSLTYRLRGKMSIRDRLLRVPFTYAGSLSLRQPATTP